MRTYARGFALVFLIVTAAGGATIHVSPTGDDRNAGTEVRPFATLARARDEIRQRTAERPINVIIHGGTYRQTATLELDGRDSDTHWEAATGEEVRIEGGIRLDPKALKPMKDQSVLQRLPAGAHPYVLVADLAAIGVQSIQGWPIKFRGAPAAPELFFNDQRIQIARWPNRTWAVINKIFDPGSVPRDGDRSDRPPVFTCADPRPRGWNTDAGAWLCGNWTYNWYDEVIRVKSIDRNSGQITLASPAFYSVKSGRFYALNLLEELDAPGEFYIDAKNRRLYFWPPAPIEHARIVLSTLDAPLLSIDKARNITFSGMIFENSLGDTIHCSDASGVRIERCTVRNVRQLGISINGGSNDVVDSCEIYDTGTGGLYLDGGDRRTLTPAHHLAINNRIHNFSRLQLTGAYAITLAGVGNRAAHNLIHDAPHQAILIAGNDNVVEYNIIRNVVTDAEDAGAVYKGATPPAAEISSTATSSATSATPTATPAPSILTTATAGIASSATSFCAAAASVPSARSSRTVDSTSAPKTTFSSTARARWGRPPGATRDGKTPSTADRIAIGRPKCSKMSIAPARSTRSVTRNWSGL